MGNTYRRLYIQVVFAVKNRKALLHESWRSDVFKYIAGIINERGHYSLAVNGYNDHVHIFFSYNGNELIADLVRETKKSSNRFINEKGYCRYRFEWQSGYGVFSYSEGDKEKIIRYVQNQKIHHETQVFRNEYIKLLDTHEIEFSKDYLFRFIE